MHNITIKGCQICHTTAPVNHPIKEPVFAQYTPSQCLECHGGPHEVTSAGGTDCIACHNPTDVNISLFGLHANINTSIKSDFMHGMTTCKVCHAPNIYHMNGTVCPLGVVENVLRKMQTH